MRLRDDLQPLGEDVHFPLAAALRKRGYEAVHVGER
jgi:hypothetical protein